MQDLKLIVRKLGAQDQLPFQLLLLADETMDAIEKYIRACNVYVAAYETDKEPCAAFALYNVDDTTIEIKNIAVRATQQGMGIGSYLINTIKQIAAESKHREIIVGTHDSALEQVRFYEKNGFVKYGVRKNFFIDNYPEPIIENGVLLRDMVMLRFSLL